MNVLIDTNNNDGSYIGRTSFDSPEVDNEVLITSRKALKAGCFYHVKIVDADIYTLYGNI